MTLDQLKQFLADLARPWVLWAGGGSASAATLMCARNPTLEGAAVVTAAWAGVFGIYWGKAWEERGKAGVAGEVEKVRAQAVAPPAEALKPAPEEPPAEPAPIGPRPPWET